MGWGGLGVKTGPKRVWCDVAQGEYPSQCQLSPSLPSFPSQRTHTSGCQSPGVLYTLHSLTHTLIFYPVIFSVCLTLSLFSFGFLSPAHIKHTHRQTDRQTQNIFVSLCFPDQTFPSVQPSVSLSVLLPVWCAHSLICFRCQTWTMFTLMSVRRLLSPLAPSSLTNNKTISQPSRSRPASHIRF